MPYLKNMNVLIELTKKAIGKALIKDALNDVEYDFKWNDPADLNEIEDFEKETGYKIPDYYKEFLLCSNGGILYRIDEEDAGFELLGIKELKEYTDELNDAGYEIPMGCYVFMRCFFSADIMLFDTNKGSRCILDGDVGYPSNEWKILNCDFNTFFARLVTCNGAMFWRW